MTSPLRFAVFLMLPLFFACESAPTVPKPRSYPKVVYPERSYREFAADYCDFTFQQPTSTSVAQEKLMFAKSPVHPCWFDLVLNEELNGKIHLSYYPITSFEEFEGLRDQAFELTEVHNKRASDIEEIVIARPEANVHGLAFDVAGPAASPFQFFLTDTTRHFLRGALYFDTQVNPDSLAPIVAYVKEDIYQMLETLEWKN